jgi:hypothetical protein
MNARASENYLAISRSSSASKSVEIYWGRLFFRAESSPRFLCRPTTLYMFARAVERQSTIYTEHS